MVLNPQAVKVVYVCERCKKATDKSPSFCSNCGGNMFIRTTVKRVVTK